MPFDISDALNHYHAQRDAIHKLWNYLGIFGTGSATIAWARERASGYDSVVWILVIAFTLFAIGNGYIVVTSQNQLYQTAQAIKRQANNKSKGLSQDFVIILSSLSPFSPRRMAIAHIMVDTLVLLIILGSTFK